MLIEDGFLFRDCRSCDGFGWNPESERPEFLPPTDPAPCKECKGLGIVRIRVEDIRLLIPEESER